MRGGGGSLIATTSCIVGEQPNKCDRTHQVRHLATCGRSVSEILSEESNKVKRE
jgi:hypothetical protein